MGLSSTLDQSTHKLPASLSHTLPHPLSFSLPLACCASYARTTNKWQSSKSNNNTFHKQKTQSTHTEANTHMHVCVCVNWLKSASGFSSALTWHLPPQCHHKPDQKFSILRKTWEIDLGQDVGAVGNVNKGKLQRNPRVCVCFVLAILCAVYGRQRVCVWEGDWCVCAVRGLNFLPVEHFIKA